MKHLMSCLVVGLLFVACGNNTQKYQAKDLLGRWKVYSVNYRGKDISKSSDPKQNNGILFEENGNYERFGMLGFQDTGSYALEEEWLIFTSQQDSLPQYNTIQLQNDSLFLVTILAGGDSLKMGLYKMPD